MKTDWIPKKVNVPVYWVLDEEDNLVFDFDLMREEFESKLKELGEMRDEMSEM